MVKIPSENAVLNFMNSVRNNDEAELIIGGILLSSYRSRKLLKKISETKEDTIKDFMAVRENANTTFEIKTDELLEDSLEHIQMTLAYHKMILQPMNLTKIVYLMIMIFLKKQNR